VRFLPALVKGRLLDVGCGSGEWLASMRERGWNVAGLDFDQDAVRIAKQSGLEVRSGTLKEQNYASKSFDAVTLHHVIEHVPDPVETLTECARILVNGGQLVLSTPNSASLGHRIFKEYWRGLEPPRHLHIFSGRSLRRVLEQAGFRNISIRPHVAPSVIYESDLLWRGRASFTRTLKRHWPSWIVAQCFSLAELGLIKFKPSVADCVVAVAVKHDSIAHPPEEVV
jgi:SAM-dependent methyltransferase